MRGLLARRQLLGWLTAGVAVVGLVPLLSRWRESRAGGAMAPFDRGLEAFRAGDYQRAAAELEEAAGADPLRAEPLVLKGMALAHMGRLQDSVEAFSHALALAPHQPTLYLYRGASLAATGDTARALNDFERAEALAAGDRRIAVAARAHIDRLVEQP